MNQRQECIKNCMSVANLELYQKIADFGNEKLGHMWDYTTGDVLKVMRAVIGYCIENGEKLPKVLPKVNISVKEKKEAEDIMLRSLRWTEADGAIIIMTYTI